MTTCVVFFPCSWVNKLNDINVIEIYEIALCILKEGQKKSGTVGCNKATREVQNKNLVCD